MTAVAFRDITDIVEQDLVESLSEATEFEDLDLEVLAWRGSLAFAIGKMRKKLTDFLSFIHPLSHASILCFFIADTVSLLANGTKCFAAKNDPEAPNLIVRGPHRTKMSLCSKE
jgi:hypothetical protein